MKVQIKFNTNFLDGNVWPEYIPPGTVLVVDEVVHKQFVNSGADVEVLGKVIPKSDAKKVTTKKVVSAPQPWTAKDANQDGKE